MKWHCEVVMDFDGRYYANLYVDDKMIEDLPDYVNYRALRKAIKEKTGIELVNQKELIFTRYGRKRYALLNGFIAN